MDKMMERLEIKRFTGGIKRVPYRRLKWWWCHRVVMEGKEGLEPWVRRGMMVGLKD